MCARGHFEVARISDTVRAHPTNSSSKIWYVWDVLRAIKRAGISDIDLATSQDPFETGLAAWLVSRRLKAKLQLQIHTDFMSPYFSRESLKNKMRVLIAKWLLPKADRIRVVSQRIKRSLSTIKQLNNSTIFVLPIFVDVKKIQSATISIDLHKKYPEFDFIILMASRLEKEKNIGLAISAMSEIVKKYPKTGLVIAGSGSQEKELRQKSVQLGLNKNVVFEGWVDDLASLYKTCDAYLLTSNYEGYGMSLIMAASAGCPIITTNVGVVGEIINKENALVIDIEDKTGIADAIIRLRSDEHLRKELFMRAKESVARIGSKEEYLKKYKESWSKIV